MTETQAAFNINDYMTDSQGRLVHKDQVEEIDKTRDELVRYIVRNALDVQRRLIDFKTNAMDQIDSFVELSAMEYDTHIGGKKGNITLYSYDGKYKLQVAIAEYLVFDERLQVAKKMIDDCLNDWTSDSRSEVKTIIHDAFSVNQEGKINTRRILGLRKLKISDPLWRRAMDAISDSLQVSGSKQYLRIYERVEGMRDAWTHISLDMAAI